MKSKLSKPTKSVYRIKFFFAGYKYHGKGRFTKRWKSESNRLDGVVYVERWF